MQPRGSLKLIKELPSPVSMRWLGVENINILWVLGCHYGISKRRQFFTNRRGVTSKPT